MIEPFFSVIINSHNGEKYLAEALGSVLSQSFEDYEIILFDNASDDGTSELAKNYSSRVRYYFSGRKLDLGDARNKAIALSRGKFIAFLDSDDFWNPTKLAMQYMAIKNYSGNRDLAICYTFADRLEESSGSITPFELGRKQGLQGDVYLDLLVDCFIPMSSVVVSKRHLLKVGGFDDNLQIIEEWDVWLKLANKFDCALVPERLTTIRFHKLNASKDLCRQEKEVLELYEKLEKFNNKMRIKRELKLGKRYFQFRFHVIRFLFYFKRFNPKAVYYFFRVASDLFLHPRVLLRLVNLNLSWQLFRFLLIKYR